MEVGEIEDAALKPGEDEALEQAYRRQVNSQRIMEGVTEAETLTGSDFGGQQNWYPELIEAFPLLPLMMKNWKALPQSLQILIIF